ncbi:hypothetical protein BU17DRAFT_100752 [Hysterangium stoloniferum]|nr:hypothetical protein BU17DRAFT_100752 [Hysterangium stoloniferum]
MSSTSLTDTGVGGPLRVPSRLALSAATTRAQIRAMDPAMRRDLFAEYITLQKHSKNLVFFDREFDEAQEFPHPMSQGRVIYPEGIPAYLHMRHIKFKCFCALLSPVLLFVEVKTIAGRTCAFCSDCGLNVIIDEKYVSANLAADYPTHDKDGAVSPVSSTPYHHIPPRTPLHRRVLITTRKRSSLAYAASHPVAAALVPPGIQAPSQSRLQRVTGTHALTQQHKVRSPLFSTPTHFRLSQSSSRPIGGIVVGPSHSHCSAPTVDRSSCDRLSPTSSLDTDRDGSPDILQFCDECAAYFPPKAFKAHIADCRGYRA